MVLDKLGLHLTSARGVVHIPYRIPHGLCKLAEVVIYCQPHGLGCSKFEQRVRKSQCGFLRMFFAVVLSVVQDHLHLFDSRSLCYDPDHEDRHKHHSSLNQVDFV
jgi:hypothetical protein